MRTDSTRATAIINEHIAEHVALHNEFRGIIIRWQLLTLPSAPRTQSALKRRDLPRSRLAAPAFKRAGLESRVSSRGYNASQGSFFIRIRVKFRPRNYTGINRRRRKKRNRKVPGRRVPWVASARSRSMTHPFKVAESSAARPQKGAARPHGHA